MKKNIKKDFPLFSKHSDLVYLDSASTTQKPQVMIDALVDFYQNQNANTGRGIYALAEGATQLYEDSRETVSDFINADSEEVVFTRNATEGINFIAQAWGRDHIGRGDEIVISELEHHANLLPWQRLATQVGAILKYIPIHAGGSLDYSCLDSIITNKTKLVAITSVSNAIGTKVDLGPIIARAHAVGAKVLVDACQSVPHEKTDVKKIDADFLVFSGHKLLGPTGIGVLYIRKALHDEVQPYSLGGGMVWEVGTDTSSWLQSPQKYEAGTTPIAQAIGLAAAITYINQNIDFDALQKHEAALCNQLIDGLQAIKGIAIYGPIDQLRKHGHSVTFTVEGMHAHDVAAYLDTLGIAVRAGHFCAQPLAQKLGYDAAVRASFYAYNTSEDVQKLIDGIAQLVTSR